MQKPFALDADTDSICQPPSASVLLLDRIFRKLAGLGVIVILSLLVALVLEIGVKAVPGIQKYGLDMLTGTVWDVGQQKFGILPAIWGTLYSSLIALLIGGFFGISVAIFLTQNFLPARLAAVFSHHRRVACSDTQRGIRAMGDFRRDSVHPPAN